MDEAGANDLAAAEAANAATANRVAAQLRKRILHGQIASGGRVDADELATLHDAGAAAVRDALRELEREGLLELDPGRGAVVRRLDAQFVRNLYDVRGAIEGMLAERCAEAVDAAAVRALGALVDAHEKSVTGRDSEAILVANRRLHEAINGYANNPEALHMLARGRVLVDALRLRYGYGHGRIESAVAEHRTLLRAIERHDAERAGGIARRHCMRARDDLLARMRQGGA